MAGTDAQRDDGDSAWSDRAESAQNALTAAFGTRLRRGGLRNTAPWRLRQAVAFNYWWLAHAIEVRIDAFERSGDPDRLQSAGRLLELLRRRNRGTLVNDYFDDMGWLAIALTRLHAATGERRFLGEAVGLWNHIRSAGWNSQCGASVAWRAQQLDYKNAPTNGVFALLSARLFAVTGESAHAHAARDALDWIETTLVDPSTGIVADGVNRLGDGGVDADWVFSYNQGLYAGALGEVAGWRAGAGEGAGGAERTGGASGTGGAGDTGAGGSAGTEGLRGAPASGDALARAERTAVAAVRLAPRGVITTENSRLDQRGGGDIGLFKGVFVRYLGELIPRLPQESAGRRLLVDFVRTSTDVLWSGIHRSPELRAGDDWSRPAPPVTFLSTQLSAVMALETRARLDRGGLVGG
ncbi:glycoside hydrolase family 76 protein [Herbiconiux ginsengi]|uniref:Predicted alpha-1,6-mannanase, GH76 family n=1 Tax=Herbiconiux ginsengi TaxID=381665 RepID=A0A1H3QFN8_9MICO|nr:glycoside hydrolase family 76 protein [Herbiconiux ginsengi]SDZ12394.1 Predicted alpha-1,6-mannanase, GH76 family [Herbiconiux ginsengi]